MTTGKRKLKNINTLYNKKNTILKKEKLNNKINDLRNNI